jgi:hypothetical protein
LGVRKEMNGIESEIPLRRGTLIIPVITTLLLRKYMLNVNKIECKNEEKRGNLALRSSPNPYGCRSVQGHNKLSNY